MRQDPMNEDPTTDQELEHVIQDWHWDARSHRFAKALGSYLFQFVDSLSAQGLSAKTVNKHCDNCWCIGLLECQYGYRDTFTPGVVFASPGAGYAYEFQRKMSDSAYAIQSYRATWRKLHTYTQAVGHRVQKT